jgi:hypothetical protein
VRSLSPNGTRSQGRVEGELLWNYDRRDEK